MEGTNFKLNKGGKGLHYLPYLPAQFNPQLNQQVLFIHIHTIINFLAPPKPHCIAFKSQPSPTNTISLHILGFSNVVLYSCWQN